MTMAQLVNMEMPSTSDIPSFWDYLHQLRLNNKLCDIQLLIRAKHPLEDLIEDFAVADCIQAHKVVLAASSQFFRKCLEKGDLLSVYNFDGVQAKNMQLLVDYMYHQVTWETVKANDEAAEVARILEVIKYDESINKLDYPKDKDGNRILIVKANDQRDKNHDKVVKHTRTGRVIIDDIEAELRNHDIVAGRGRRKVMNAWETSIGSPLVVTETNKAMGTTIVTMEEMQMEQQDGNIMTQVIEEASESPVGHVLHLEEPTAEFIPAGNSAIAEEIHCEDALDCESGEVLQIIMTGQEAEKPKPMDASIPKSVPRHDLTGNMKEGRGTSAPNVMKYVLQGSTARAVEDQPSTILTVKKVKIDKNLTAPPTTDEQFDSNARIKQYAEISRSNKEPTEVEVQLCTDSQRSCVDADTKDEASGKKVEIFLHDKKVSTGVVPVLSSGESVISRYATRFRGQKRVVEVLAPKAKRKKLEENSKDSTESPECTVNYATCVDGHGCDYSELESTPKTSSVKVVTLDIDRGVVKKEHLPDIYSQKPLQLETAATALPSFSEQTQNLAIEGTVQIAKKKRGRPRKQGNVSPQGNDLSGRIPCTLCSKTFKNVTGLSIHRQWKHGTSDAVGQKKQAALMESYTCEYCNKVCACFQALVQHMRCLHNKQPTHKCDTCNVNFTTKRAYNAHIVQAHNSSLYKCEICDTSFKSPEGFKIHMFKQHTKAENTFHCSKCAKTFKMKHELAIHLKVTHATERAYKCRLCTRDFKGKAALKRHLETYHSNRRTMECNVCSLLFKTKNDMLNHERKHFRYGNSTRWKVGGSPGSSDHKCSRCGKSFKKLAILLAHERQVHQAKDLGISYMCTMCVKSYTTKSYLLNHIRQTHLPRRFKCQQCLYEFPHQYMLRKHQPKCKGYPIISKPYRCTKCNRYFNLKGNLTRHIRTFGRCRKTVHNYADYIVMLKSDEGSQMTVGRLHGEDSAEGEEEQVTLEALQASEALQQLQASGQTQDQIQGQIQDQIQGQIQDQIQDQIQGQIQDQIQGQIQGQIQIDQNVIQDNVQILDGNEVFLDGEQMNLEASGMEDQDMSNLVLPEGLRAMQIKKDEDGNVVIVVASQSGDDAGGDPQHINPSHDHVDGNLQIITPDNQGTHQVIQTESGEFVLQTMDEFQESTQGDPGEVHVEAIEVSDPGYTLQGHGVYQIGPDGTLQHVVESDVLHEENIQNIEDGNSSIQVAQSGGSIHFVQGDNDGVHIVENDHVDDQQFIVKEEL